MANVKALALCGSQHAGGSTEHLLKTALDKLRRLGVEGSLLPMLWKKVFPCTGCGYCAVQKNGTCRQEGDDFAALYKALRQADIVLVGAPVDRGAAHPDFKAFLARSCCVARASGNPLSRKVGAPVAVVAREASRHGLQRLLGWFPAQDIIVPGSAAYPLEKGEPVLGIKADAAGDAVMEGLAENLAWLAGKVKESP